MTAISWNDAVNGDWNNASNWSTNTVPGSGDAVAISATGPYIVTIDSADFANSLTFNASQAALVENAGSLTMVGALTVDSGFVSLNKANTIGSVALAGGRLAFGNGAAFGTGTVTLSGGELLATANETVTNELDFTGTSTIAAAHGMTLNENASSINIAVNATLNFGAVGQDGVVIWHTQDYDIATPFAFNVVAGTLKAADGGLNDMIGFGGQSTTVDAGATLDTGGFGLNSANLLGGGAIIDSGAADTLTLGGADFSGVISGSQSLVANGTVTLSGDNTYTGTTTIGSSVAFEIGLDGTAGSIGGGAISIGSGGTLYIDRSNALTLTNAISGAGLLRLVGSGVTSINTANTYSGGTLLSAGTLAVGNSGALGTGTVTFGGGELLATANETLTNALLFSGSSTIAAAHGTTLNENASSYSVNGNSTLNFGALGQDGTILWHTPGDAAIDPPFPAIDVQAGTLKGADSNFGFFLDDEPITVAAGATLDVAGSSAEFTDLQGGGSVINSGAAVALTLDAANFSGIIAGALSLGFAGNASLSGLENYTGGATLEGSATVANSGTYDIVSNNGISGTSASLFVNDGLFEKTGGGGASDVTSNFANYGALDVLSGSIAFSGGFTNHGVIHGLVTQSGGVTTISAPVSSDFNGDGLSEVLLRNGAGAFADWTMNGSAISSSTLLTSGGNAVTLSSAWSVDGVADFNGDGKADILMGNSNGTFADWTMNGSQIASSQLLTAQGATETLSSAWSVAGLGDFNGDGETDILLHNSNGTFADWTMNGSKIESSQLLTSQGTTVAPSSAWSVAGIGDFDGDGKADVLLRNTNGTFADWSMNGSQIESSQLVSSQGATVTLGSAWSVAGIGDFNGDGLADVLLRNSNGTLADWTMNGSKIASSQLLTSQGTTVTLDPSWSIAALGDFNGDGKTDILLKNTSGAFVEWTMNGSAITAATQVTSSGQPVAAAAWQAQGNPTDLPFG